jgi:hypothetical protein
MFSQGAHYNDLGDLYLDKLNTHQVTRTLVHRLERLSAMSSPWHPNKTPHRQEHFHGSENKGDFLSGMLSGIVVSGAIVNRDVVGVFGLNHPSV